MEDIKTENYLGTGRRKNAVARVRVSDGTGKFIVNGKELLEFFPSERQADFCKGPLTKLEITDKMDVTCTVHGGGFTGQSGSIVMGLARALLCMSTGYEAALREDGYLTRDSRMVERKKYGRHGARRSTQFSKR